MNYLHMKSCVERAPVPPMEQHLYDSMVRLLPSQLTVKYADVLKELHDEITSEFEVTMRKSRGNTTVVCWQLLLKPLLRPFFACRQ